MRAGVRFIDGKQPERDDEEIKIEEPKKAGKRRLIRPDPQLLTISR